MHPICLHAAVIVSFGIAFTPDAYAESKYNPYTTTMGRRFAECIPAAQSDHW